MRKGGILTLDLSTHVGACFGYAGDTAPMWSKEWVLPDTPYDIGRRFAAYENKLLAAFTEFEPERVVMEAPLIAAKQGSHATAEIQIGLAAITECACYRWEKPLARRAVTTLRSAVLGNGHIPSDEKPRIVMAWCNARGWRPPTHNCADAMIVWAYEVGIRHERAKPTRKRA